MVARGTTVGDRIRRLFAIVVPRIGRGRPGGENDTNWFDDYNVTWSLRQRLRFGRILFGRSSSFNRGIKLLLENLSPSQRDEYLRYGYFHVVGGKTKRLYRIATGRQVNVHELNDKKRRVCIWCFYPAGNLVDGDVMLAQKLALELFEDEALSIANRLSNYCEPLGS